MSGVFAFNVSDYDYKLSLTPECSEYMGNVRFEIPSEIGRVSDAVIYSEDDISIDDGMANVRLNRNSDWYVNSVPGHSVSEVENLFDGNFASDFVCETSGIKITFQNPLSVPVDKIIIDTKDSQVSGFEVLENGDNVGFSLNKNKFHYELILDEFSGNEIDVILNFDGLLKVREISFFEESDDEVSYGYFYVDDDCNRTREIYFGRYGENRFSRGSKSMPVYFNVDSKLMANSEYDSDFDGDGHKNEADNCPRVSNFDQKDIDYNDVGDACDDFDRDGVLNVDDNCVKVSNRNQVDNDGDGMGDACDDGDDRFFEKNIEVLILLVIVIVGAFGFLTYKIAKH